MKKETAYFALGCFWNPQLVFSKIKGVKETQVGYMGGKTSKPSYEMVCSGEKGHAEAVKIVFDSDVLSYNDLLELFWNNHNPTSLNRQGPDIGTQYRSAIFYVNENQRKIAEKSKEEKQKSRKDGKKIVTEIVKALEFYPAEEYHQDYLKKRGMESCHI